MIADRNRRWAADRRSKLTARFEIFPRRVLDDQPVMHGHMGSLGFFPFGLLSGLGGLLFLAGIVLLVVWFIRGMAGSSSWRQRYAVPAVATSESPLDILSRRFASGEITAEDFQKARDLLRETPKS
jgi:uncharacterized membrane protein